jgi:hypothetical protein
MTGSKPNNHIRKLGDLIRDQLNIAVRWLERGKISSDNFTKFYFYFSGFNSIFFLWKEVDDFKNKKGKRPSDKDQIEHLLRKFDEEKASDILQKVADNVKYFCERDPIQRMDKRNPANLHIGDPDEGKQWQDRLKDRENSLQCLVALGEIIYLIRSNLVHGSKGVSGDDQEIIDSSITPLEILLKEVISMTKDKCLLE